MPADTLAPWAEPVLLTAEDLLSLPDGAQRYELVQGHLVKMTPAGFEHGVIASRVLLAVGRFVDDRALGRVTGAETGFMVSTHDQPDTVLAPDLAFVSAAHVPVPGSADWTGFPRLAPDLAVEIASPKQGRPEMAAKGRLWLASGVRLLWIVWPVARQIDVWKPGHDSPVMTLGAADELDGEEVLPGFRYPVRSLFDS